MNKIIPKSNSLMVISVSKKGRILRKIMIR